MLYNVNKNPIRNIAAFGVLIGITCSTFYHISLGTIEVENFLVMLISGSSLLSLIAVRKIRMDIVHRIYILYMLYAIITSLWSPGASITTVKLIICAIFLGLFQFTDGDEKWIDWSILITSLIVIILLLTKGQYYLGGNRYSIVLNDGTIMEQNSFFGFCLLLYSKSISVLLNRNKELKASKYAIFVIFSTTFILVLAYFVLITSSRGTMITMLVMTAVAGLIYHRNNIRVLFLLLIGIGAIYYIYNNVLSEALMERLSFSYIRQTGAANRTEIWKEMFQYFGRRSFFANIFGDGLYSVKPLQGLTSHNVYIECFSEYGVIGFLLFMLLHFRLLRLEIRGKNRILLISHIGVLVWGLSIAMNNELMYWCIIIILIQKSYYSNHRFEME